MNKRMMGGVALAAILSLSAALAACDNGPSAVESRDRGDQVLEQAGEAAETAAEAVVGGSAEASIAWAESRRGTPQENAERAFERNGRDFDATSVEDFARKANTFISRPPAGTEILQRSNGDRLFYHPATNTFAVANSEGRPRTMFKPDDGAAYWDVQKARVMGSSASQG